MATPIPARLSAGEGRRFGFVVGGAFLALAALGAWRGRPHQALVCGALGALLVLAGVIVPERLGPVFRAWSALGHVLSRITTPVFLGCVYFLVLTPVGLVMRLLGRRPLVRPDGAPSWWVSRAPHARQRTDMERQF